MYEIYYWAYSPRFLCGFDVREDAEKALNDLKRKYPESRIWMSEGRPLKSYDEWKDRMGVCIPAYEED